MQLLATTKEGGLILTCWFITPWHCRTKSIGEPCREKEEKWCATANSKLYLHLSKQEESLFLANTISCQSGIEAGCKSSACKQWPKPTAGGNPSSHVMVLEVPSPRPLTLCSDLHSALSWVLKTLVTSLDRDVTSVGKERAPGTCLQNWLC